VDGTFTQYIAINRTIYIGDAIQYEQTKSEKQKNSTIKTMETDGGRTP
jgi:hypothetical protein